MHRPTKLKIGILVWKPNAYGIFCKKVIDFIPKGLTTTGVITPYSTIGVENNSSNQTPEFTVYDASFNVEKTFQYDPRVFKSNLVPMKALADQTAFPATSHCSVRQIPKVYLILAANARS